MEVYKLLQKGAHNRTTAATKLNHESSRSHAVFTIIVEHSELNIASEEWESCAVVLLDAVMVGRVICGSVGRRYISL